MAKLPNGFIIGISSERITKTIQQIKTTLEKYNISNEDAKSIVISLQNSMVLEAKTMSDADKIKLQFNIK